MKPVDPVAVWDVRPWGCDTFRVDDFNGDGKHEVLFLQTSGCHAHRRHDPRFPEFKGYKTGIEEQELFCMTLTDGEGNILWQVGEPWALERPFSWNGHWNEFCHVVDFDGDGQVEILFVHKDDMRVYDGATGALRHQAEMPHPGAYYTRAVRTDHSGQYHIFAHVDPCFLLSSTFDVVWEKDAPGARPGHFGSFADVDGDGLDELLAGFSLFDHDGTLLWAHPPASEGDHLDDARIADIDGDGRLEIALAHDGHDAVVHNDDGAERFRVQMHHCQNILIGKFFADTPGLQLVLMDKTIGPAGDREGVAVDAWGRELSRHRNLGYYSAINWATDVGPLSLIRVERPVEPDGEHRVMWVAPTGEELASFKVRSSFYDRIQRHGLDRLPGRGRYYGTTHSPAIGDVDGDGCDELLVTDRERVWIFERP